ncbi:hypothetical protein GOBAR_AA10448 [Gossypium barbadense]|uniref:Uncharacterized protein n=1 Tax=Gossypium barbadense TaxID=3634 RepID=A0A2P5Y3K6_GOSBA|nr:hypothetical protein GOBAR_AA10448 [Gossypium barbadense]
MSLKEAHESFSSNSRGPIHEDRRLQIEELDEWKTHKPRTLGKPKLCQNEPDTSPNQVMVGDKVLLDATDPHIITTTPNKEIPLTILNIIQSSTLLSTCGQHCQNDTGVRKPTRPWEKRTTPDMAVRHDPVATWPIHTGMREGRVTTSQFTTNTDGTRTTRACAPAGAT